MPNEQKQKPDCADRQREDRPDQNQRHGQIPRDAHRFEKIREGSDCYERSDILEAGDGAKIAGWLKMLLIKEASRRAEHGDNVHCDRPCEARSERRRRQFGRKYESEADQAERDAAEAPERCALSKNERRENCGRDGLNRCKERGDRSGKAATNRPPHPAEIDRMKQDAADERMADLGWSLGERRAREKDDRENRKRCAAKTYA